MCLEEAEALGADLEGLLPRHGEELERWNRARSLEQACRPEYASEEKA